MVQHTIHPVYDENSKVLILGSFPSVKSREQKFFYGHPQNRFWKVLAAVLGAKVPQTVEEKKRMLITHHVAVWDVVASCDIDGSADTTIRNVVPNDMTMILNKASILKIVVNGNKAYELYMKYIYPNVLIKPLKLPSTSPANAAFSVKRLVEAWSVIKDEIDV